MALALIGCGSNTTVDPTPLVVASTKPADAGVADAAVPADPRCAEPCLFLGDTPLDQQGDAYRAACGKPLVPDNADCGALDYARNCIYAAHGMRFHKKKWQVYSSKSWYHLRTDFKNRELSKLEHDNVHELYLRGRACRHHDVHVSTADYARIQTWFRGYAKGAPEIPAIAVSGDDLVRPAELGATLAGLHLALAKDTWMAYHDADRVVARSLAGRKLRDAIVDLSTCVESDDCGTYVHFVFDEHDALVALVLTDH